MGRAPGRPAMRVAPVPTREAVGRAPVRQPHRAAPALIREVRVAVMLPGRSPKRRRLQRVAAQAAATPPGRSPKPRPLQRVAAQAAATPPERSPRRPRRLAAVPVALLPRRAAKSEVLAVGPWPRQVAKSVGRPPVVARTRPVEPRLAALEPEPRLGRWPIPVVDTRSRRLDCPWRSMPWLLRC